MTTGNDPFELVGTTIEGRYDVEACVEETGLSVVYRAVHRVWRRPVAIKAFKSATRDPQEQRALLEAFVREGALLGELSEHCAAICQAREVGAVITRSGDWMPFLVLEWLEGTPLDRLLKSEREAGGRRRTEEEAFDLLHPVATALGLAHEHGVVHSDVKPGNIVVLTEPGGLWPCKLLDFGIARVTRRGAAGEDVPLISFTPQYAAPEQFSAEYGAIGPWTDVYALALIFVELVIGHEALEGDTVGALALRSCDPERRPTPETLGAAVSGRLEHALGRALALRPEDRFENAKAFWQDMAAAVRPVRGPAAGVALPIAVEAKSA